MSVPCPACGADDVKTGVSTVGLTRDGDVILVEGVPAEICNSCTQFALDEVTSAEVLRLADEALARGDHSVQYGAA